MDTTTDLAHIVKLWLEENNNGYWNIRLTTYHMFDVIEMNHIFQSINKHDNEVIIVRMTIPHSDESYRYMAFAEGNQLGSQIKIPPSDPNFFEYLRDYINKAIMTYMADLHKKLQSGLRYRGIYAESSDTGRRPE